MAPVVRLPRRLGRLPRTAGSGARTEFLFRDRFDAEALAVELTGIPLPLHSLLVAVDRVLNAYDSEYNGLTFCQGHFAAMGG